MPEVSIVLPAYNGERFIKETLGSLLAQTHKDFEVIIVDDGSTDRTAAIVRDFMDSRLRGNDEEGAPRTISRCGASERIKYFYKENSGNQAIPRNFGIKKARGEYIAFCDQDDVWYPKKLEEQLNVIKRERDSSARRSTKSVGMTKNIGLIVSSADIINERGSKVGVRYVPEGYMDPKESFEMLLGEDFITMCSVLIPKKVLDEMGFLNESLRGNDDYDLWLRITRKYGIYGIGQPLCAWRRSEKAYSKDMSKIFKENEKIFKSLKSNSKTKRLLIKDGANKNLVRLFIAYVKEKKYGEAKEVLSKVKPFEGLAQVKFTMKVFKVSPSLARISLLAVNQLKKRS